VLVRIPQQFLVHTVSVRPLTGRSSSGAVYGSQFDLSCLAEGKRRMVRDPNGNLALSSLTLYAAPGQAATVPPGSQVTWNGATTTVMASIDHDSGGLGAPDHTEVVCE
jgi:hypothetical protein